MFLETYTGNIDVLDEVHMCTLFPSPVDYKHYITQQHGNSALHCAINRSSELISDAKSDALEMFKALIARNADVTKTDLVHVCLLCINLHTLIYLFISLLSFSLVVLVSGTLRNNLHCAERIHPIGSGYCSRSY
jgi:hypothetical protein